MKIFETNYTTGSIEKKLYDRLKQETANMKAVYLQRVKTWAHTKHAESVEIMNWPASTWIDLGYATPTGDPRFCRKNKEGTALYWRARDICRMGLEKYTEKRLYMAELHYYNSLDKLVSRLIAKGMSDDFTIITSGMDINIEMVLESNGKKVRAWTIEAGGDVQCDHYRYLVK